MSSIQSLVFFIGHYVCFCIVKIAEFLLPEKRLTDEKSALYLCPYIPENAGDIYRAKKWAEILSGAGWRADVKTTLTKNQYNAYLANNDVRFYLITLYKRVWQILSSYQYNVVIVRRELLLFNDYGNLFAEKLLLKIHPQAILDFDDDIAYAKGEPREVTSFFGKAMMENGAKFTNSLLLYQRFIVASNYLKNYILETNKELKEDVVCIIPTCVDYKNHPQKEYLDQTSAPLVFGWIGSNGNLTYLEDIIPQLDEVNKTIPIKLLVISGTDFTPEANFEIENLKWSYETQIEDLLKIDVGLMPLRYTPENMGKGGFKLIQYMGLGIVSAASAVTINREIIDDQIDGFLVDENEDWVKILSGVLSSPHKFRDIGNRARKKIDENYSFLSQKDKYVSFVSRPR